MKSVRLFLAGLLLIAMASACAKRYTCPTYLKNDTEQKPQRG